MRRLLSLVAIAVACRAAPPPHGEILVVVDTDAPVPGMVSRLRVDLFTADGRWFESREYPARAATDWPLSFSVWTDREDAPSVIRARLRAFPEGRTRAYFGERFRPKLRSPKPILARDLATLCAPPTIELGKLTTLRTGPDDFFSAKCVEAAYRGSAAAARFVLDAEEDITAGVVRGLVGSTRVLIRRSCADETSTVLCDDLPVRLGPGTYDLIVVAGGSRPEQRWSDREILVARTAEWAELARAATPADVQGEPRLLRDGDATPSLEPRPESAIDRLIELHIRPSERAVAHVVLHGACAGTMADLAGGRTCVEEDGVLGAVTAAPLDAWGSAASAKRAFMPPAECPRAPSEGQVCVPGGAFLLGDLASGDPDTPLFTVPEKPAVVEPFLLDRTEMSWKRLRAMIAAGLAPPPPPVSCAAPTDDDMPVTCVTWSYARSVCRFAGGDLPTEAEWEWAASATIERTSKRRFPWGNAPSTGCAAANIMHCPPEVERVHRVDGEPWATSDRTPFGAIGMLGNVREWTVDAAARFDAPAWRGNPVVAPVVDDPDAALHVVRGLAFTTGGTRDGVFGRDQFTAVYGVNDLGFRCAYR